MKKHESSLQRRCLLTSISETRIYKRFLATEAPLQQRQKKFGSPRGIEGETNDGLATAAAAQGLHHQLSTALRTTMRRRHTYTHTHTHTRLRPNHFFDAGNA